MKRILLYALIGYCTLSFTACNDSIENATSKHVYSENESPYLKVNADALVTKNIEFSVGHFAAQTINLSDYATQFQKNMNMTVDQVISGLKNGTVVFYNINTTRNIWNKAAMTKGTTGWYYNSAGGVCADNDASQTVSLDIDTNAKTLIINPNSNAKAGTVLSFNVGFAVKGPDYDNYVRFLINVSITDPTIILTSISIPAGDYNTFGIDFTQYAANIQKCMGMSVKDFLANLDYDSNTGNPTSGTIHMYMVDPVTGAWDSKSTYTADAPGYWINGKGAVCNWGDTGFSLFADTNSKDQMLYIGRAPALKAGNKYLISVGYKDTKNPNNFFRFIITATLQ
ncbi:MAG: DUF4859 domain-containing protein [Bacteroidota bacterium]|nr:DUF4859 domain-containing protein [Bacteroidota bacterium]